MTREERKLALYCLKASSDYHSEVCEECINYPNCDHTIQDDVTETIIEALEQEPCEVEAAQLQKAYNKGFEDCRQATIEAFQMFREYESNRTNAEWVDRIETIVKKLPSVNPQPKTGHWIAVEDEEMETVGYYCSECDLPMETEQRTHFCPNCGAKMVEPQERSE